MILKADAFIISLAYPETIVRLPQEWYSKFMHYFGIGNSEYVRAGHAALVLIHRQTGELEYYDFGRYITPKGFGRLRSNETDHELTFDLKADIFNEKIENLSQILKYFTAKSQLTHGHGSLYASVCNSVNYDKTKSYLRTLQDEGFIKYAAFIKEATNCARLVADALIMGGTDKAVIKKLKLLQRFTPSTLGTIAAAKTGDVIYHVLPNGTITHFNGSVNKINSKHLLKGLKAYQPSLEGTLLPLKVKGLHHKAQWLGGIGAGAWFVLLDKNNEGLFRFKRISAHGNIDTDSLYEIEAEGFNYDEKFQFQYGSNCKKLLVKQGDFVFQFNFKQKFKAFSLEQMVH